MHLVSPSTGTFNEAVIFMTETFINKKTSSLYLLQGTNLSEYKYAAINGRSKVDVYFINPENIFRVTSYYFHSIILRLNCDGQFQI